MSIQSEHAAVLDEYRRRLEACPTLADRAALQASVTRAVGRNHDALLHLATHEPVEVSA